MVETPYVVWILTFFVYVILIRTFSRTTCFVKRSCLRQLRNDQQRPGDAYHHLQSTMKRADFIIDVGFLEVCAGLVVLMEVTAVKFDIAHDKPGNGFSPEYSLCAGQLHYIACAVVGCLFLSIVRCLAQRYALERLSKSDVVSMTRVYLVPATCLVTVLCVWSWFHPHGDQEKKQPTGEIVCYHANQTSPLNSFLLILLPILWNMVIDYWKYRTGKTGYNSKYVGSQLAADDGLRYDSTFLKQTNLVSEVVHSHEHPTHTVSKTSEYISQSEKEIANTNPALSANAILPTRISNVEHKSVPVKSTDETAVRSIFVSLRDFLKIYLRIYLVLVIYLAAMIGVYAFLASCYASSRMEDLTTVVFMVMLMTTAVLRAMQVTVAAEVEKRAELKITQIDV